ncbi:MAG TPA: putative toxin-antitoxin system toxin component, PIN family, partial [Desulfosporosinus sp.]|nr:putative toxin-antitoxin system toxin component, PIN family [Desulfosporosinus sp.]
MKILADTNILISALLWPNSKPAAALLHAARYHEL